MCSFKIFALLVMLCIVYNPSHAQDYIDTDFPLNQLQSFNVADFNNDGFQDIIGFRYLFSTNEIYSMISDTLTPFKYKSTLLNNQIPILGRPAQGDLDNDGDVDIILSEGQDKSIFLYRNDRLDGFSAIPLNISGTDNLSMLDIDLDGDQDIIGYRDYPGLLKQFVNTNGIFSEIVLYSGSDYISDVCIGDLNSDQRSELVIGLSTSTGGKLILYKNNASGTFDSAINFRSLPSIRKIKILDTNYDGKKDLACLTQFDVIILEAKANQVFGYDEFFVNSQSEFSQVTFDIADYNLDGKLDMVITRLFGKSVFYKNKGSENSFFSFQELPFAGEMGANPIVFTDLDNDSDLDYLSINGKLSILENLKIVDKDRDGFDRSIDCDDKNRLVNPSIIEICDGIDNDCDGLVDGEFVFYTYYSDFDYDGFGDDASPITSCMTLPPYGYASVKGDCNDSDPLVNPSLLELCDMKDNDCDGLIDDGLPFYTYFLDRDEDGFGINQTITTCNNTPETGFSVNNTDCNDFDRFNFPGGLEFCDAKDNDCDGLLDEELIFITYYLDNDKDGFGTKNADTSSCMMFQQPIGFVTNDKDCDDNNSDINPNSIDVCDYKDNNCDGIKDEGNTVYTFYFDRDKDGYGSLSSLDSISCTNALPPGYSVYSNDCNDFDASNFPGGLELCDDLDNDCDSVVDEGLSLTTFYQDKDGDGYGSLLNDSSSCAVFLQPTGYVTNHDDCNDNDSNINPNKTEICDGIDNDCNSTADEGLLFFTYYEDKDGDGFGTNDIFTTCLETAPIAYTTNNTDCDDSNALVNPNGLDVTTNNIDEDCNGSDFASSTIDVRNDFIHIWPNPTRSSFSVESSLKDIISIKLLNLSGRTVSTYYKISNIDVSEIPNGLYIAQIKTASKVYYGNVVIQH